MWRFRPNFPNNLYLAKIGFNKSLRSLFRYSGQIPQIWPDPTKSLILRQKRLAQARISQKVYLEPKWLRYLLGTSHLILHSFFDEMSKKIEIPASLSPLRPQTTDVHPHRKPPLLSKRTLGRLFPVDRQDNSSS